MELPDYNKISFKEQAPVPLGEVLPDASPQALDLLGQFLLYPPRQRISASQVGGPHCPDPPHSCPCDPGGQCLLALVLGDEEPVYLP